MTEASYWAPLLEKHAEKIGDKPFLYVVYQDRYITYSKMDKNANRIANYLLKLGARPGDGVATLMGNSPQFLELFFGIQKIGMYINPVNTGLRGDSLSYIIDNSDARFLVVDYDLINLYRSIENDISKVNQVIVNTVEAPDDFVVPEDMKDLKEAYKTNISETKPKVDFDKNLILIIMYTSGTTGLPKGVVFRYNKNFVERLIPLARIALKPDSVYYTALPLFHGNALFITMTQVLIVGCTMALSKKFSASRFWEEIWKSKATIFNTIGAIIPILIKQPEHPHEKDHNVDHIISAGCPADMWVPFEKRFNVKIWEAYGAIDGSGLIFNFGDGPKGSLGKPFNSTIRIVDENGNDVPVMETGELLFKVPKNRKSKVEYYKSPEASEKKTENEWEHTGDLMYQDDEGYLYFVGRCTDSMRRRGENVSAYEVEKAILMHPDVQECAVYGVPSEMTEDEIMASIRLVEGKKLTPKELWNFLQDKLAKFAIPRYIRIVEDFPRTETFRIKKNELKKQGVTEDTWDAEKQN